MSFTIIRADERHHWRNEWLESWQSFPATGNFDLAANAHGVLLVHNDDRVDAGEGLDRHQHRDAEIVTWVLDGALRHRDSAGNDGILKPGIVQRMTAAAGSPTARATPPAVWTAPICAWSRCGLLRRRPASSPATPRPTSPPRWRPATSWSSSPGCPATRPRHR